MATVERYLRYANTSAAHFAAIGANVTAGGGGGTSGNPYATWAQLMGDVESFAPDHSADDLVCHIHPATNIPTPGVRFDTWTGLGRSTNWRSITLQRWQEMVDAEPLYADWYPTFDTLTYVASGSWTQGSISAGTWSAGTGDVFKLTGTQARYSDINYFHCWVGHEAGDTRGGRGSWNFAGTPCRTLSDVTQEGDYQLTQNGTTVDVYFKTGTTGSNPTAKYGSFCFHARGDSSVLGQVGLDVVNCKGITFRDMQAYGGALFGPFASGTGAEVNEDHTLIRPRHFMSIGQGIQMQTGDDGAAAPYNNPYSGQIIRNIYIEDPVMIAGESPRRAKGAFTVNGMERGQQHGIFLAGVLENVDIRMDNGSTIEGYSHGAISITHGIVNTPYADQYPKNVHLYSTDGTGTLVGSLFYARALIFLVPINGTVSNLRISQQTIQSQIGGQVRLRSVYFDDTCINWRDNLGTGQNDQNGGQHLWMMPGPGANITTHDVRVIGGRHVVTDNFVFWGTTTTAITPPDEMQFIGNLIVDLGGVRYFPDATDAQQGYTRLTTPFLCETKSSGAGPEYGIKRNLFVLDSACLGIANRHTGSGMPSANATVGNYPVVAATATAWSGQITQNQADTLTNFGFDANLSLLAAPNTPSQTGPRSGRNYR
jgi:hypothetical protein